MLKDSSIEDLTFRVLQRGGMRISNLIEGISHFRPKTTKQGIYRILRKLRKEEKVVTHGKSVSLNIQWLQKMGEFFSLAQYYYEKKIDSPDSFLSIGRKDRVVYYFSNLNFLDSFASHVLHLLDVVVDKKEPLFVYNPHEWFAYAREEAEQMIIKTYEKSERSILVIATHNDPLDRELKRRFSSDMIQYHISSKSLVKNDSYYFAFVGEYLIEIFIDKEVNNAINIFYKNTPSYSEIASKELSDLVLKRGRHKLVISRNMRKIDNYRKALSKYFYVKKA